MHSAKLQTWDPADSRGWGGGTAVAWARSNKCKLTDMQLGSVKKLIIAATTDRAEAADAEAAVIDAVWGGAASWQTHWRVLL